MTDQEKLEEAHGLWELAVARLAAFVEAGVEGQKLLQATAEERRTFAHWQRISDRVTSV